MRRREGGCVERIARWERFEMVGLDGEHGEEDADEGSIL